MAKWACACGATIRSNGLIPNPDEWLMISDVEFIRFDNPVDPETIYRGASHAFLCPNCGRVHVFWDGMEQDPVVYVRE